MKTFYAVTANSLVASLTNTSVWFAVTFWVYLQTGSVITTSVMAGVYTVIVVVICLSRPVGELSKATGRRRGQAPDFP